MNKMVQYSYRQLKHLYHSIFGMHEVNMNVCYKDVSRLTREHPNISAIVTSS